MRRPDWDELLGRGRLQRLPQLEPVAFRVDRVTEPPVALLGDLVLDRRTGRPQLREHRVQAGHPEVQHRLLVHATEVIGVGTERGERGHARLLLPRATGRDAGDAEVRLVPGGEGIRILRAEEVTADSEYALHAATLPRSCRAATETDYIDRVLASPPHRVWQALTRPDALAAWFWPEQFGTTVTVDLRAGGQYRIAA